MEAPEMTGGCFEYFYADIFENVSEMDKILGKHKTKSKLRNKELELSYKLFIHPKASRLRNRSC